MILNGWFRIIVACAALLVMTLMTSACGQREVKMMTTNGSGAANASGAATASGATKATGLPTIRIKAGVEAEFKDSKGTVWAADSGFDGGQTVDRSDSLQITGTDRPELYKIERYFDQPTGAYNFKVPNGRYVVKLHFSEDYDQITEASQRVFTYAVKDGDATGKLVKEVKDFSPIAAAGGPAKAYVDSIPVTVTTGQISIVFTAQVEHPQINAIEIVPQ